MGTTAVSKLTCHLATFARIVGCGFIFSAGNAYAALMGGGTEFLAFLAIWLFGPPAIGLVVGRHRERSRRTFRWDGVLVATTILMVVGACFGSQKIESVWGVLGWYLVHASIAALLAYLFTRSLILCRYMWRARADGRGAQ